MLISTADFNRLATAAYRGAGGLWVMNTGEAWQFGGARWRIWIMQDFLPKKCLGKIVELAGKLPGRGEAFVVDKEGVRYEAPGPAVKSAKISFDESDTFYEPTRLILSNTEPNRVLQNDGKALVFVPEKFYAMISANYLDIKNGEGPIMGPKANESDYWRAVEGICWATDKMAIAFCPAPSDDTKREAALLEGWHITRVNETSKAEGQGADPIQVNAEILGFARKTVEEKERDAAEEDRKEKTKASTLADFMPKPEGWGPEDDRTLEKEMATENGAEPREERGTEKDTANARETESDMAAVVSRGLKKDAAAAGTNTEEAKGAAAETHAAEPEEAAARSSGKGTDMADDSSTGPDVAGQRAGSGTKEHGGGAFDSVRKTGQRKTAGKRRKAGDE